MLQVAYINSRFLPDKLGELVANPVAAGFLIASVLWLKENESALYEKIFAVILPKDFLRLKLTGNVETELTDAAPDARL